MSRRSGIRTSTKVSPLPIDHPTLLYCNHDNCSLNSLYQCSYCKNNMCIRHAKLLDHSICVCVKCILTNNTLYNIYGAIKINKNSESTWKNKLKYICSMQWIYCNTKR